MVKWPEAATCMIEHAVENDAHAARVRRVEQFAQRLVPAEHRIDVEVVIRVIAMVRCARKDRAEVERGDAELLQFAKSLGDAAEIAPLEAVARWCGIPRFEWTGRLRARRSCESVGEDLIEDSVAHPGWCVWPRGPR